MNTFKPIRLRRSPLMWRIYTRGDGFRAVAFWPVAEARQEMDDRARERRAGIRRERYPWVPGDAAGADAA